MIFFTATWPDGHEEVMSVWSTELDLNVAKTVMRALSQLGDRNRNKHGSRFEVKWEIIDVPTLH